ncbi:uncharacterized protein [Clytia hemisphaerica]|uniref:PA14 domain-containing protein n=1 Tax=Clytia hemisphaerica TaxID=252671 RepID=A0A7M5UVY2_9CNID
MKRARIFSLLMVLKIHLINAHNILRLADQRSAKFLLRHDGKVPNREPYIEFKTDSVEVCMDRCVAGAPCKSINYNSTLQTCQHIDYDINDGKDYGTKPGWQHYDTGKTQLTRILDGTQNYCVTNTESDPCNPGSGSYYYLRYKPITDASCTGIEAYYEFDETLGTIKHHCSGLFLIKYIGYVTLQPESSLSGSLLTDELNRWRKNSYNFLDHHHSALYPYNGLSDGTWTRYTSYNVLPGAGSTIVLDRIVHPVKFEMMHTTISNFDNFESEFRSRFANGYQKTVYQSDFNIYPSMGDTYAVRMQALFSPDVTGTYSFWLRGDDYALLFIGEDEAPASRQFVAKRPNNYAYYHTDAKGEKFLEKEKLYYIELLFYEHFGGDWLICSMIRPGDVDRIIVSSDHLYPLP